MPGCKTSLKGLREPYLQKALKQWTVIHFSESGILANRGTCILGNRDFEQLPSFMIPKNFQPGSLNLEVGEDGKDSEDQRWGLPQEVLNP